MKSIPLNDSESEDEVTSGDEDFDEEADDEDSIDEENDEDEYEMKWDKKVKQMTVAAFTHCRDQPKFPRLNKM